MRRNDKKNRLIREANEIENRYSNKLKGENLDKG